MEAAAEMPRYQCHKKVWALKIANIEQDWRSSDVFHLTWAEIGYAPIEVDAAYVKKHDPKVGGYYIVYGDGYKSFSPAQAFEEGYTRI